MGLLTPEKILLLWKHAEIFMDNYQADMILQKVLVELVVNLIVKVEEVMQNVNIVAKNMGRIKAGIKIKIKIEGKQYVTENQVSQICRVTRVSLANVVTPRSNQQCVQMNTFPSPRECAELCCVSRG